MLAAVPGCERQLGAIAWFAGSNAELLRGAAFALALIDPTATALLGEAAVYTGTWPGGTAFARDKKVADGCVAALGMIGTDDAVAALASVQQQVKNRTVRKQIDKALQAAATAAGLGVDELVERVVPTYDLGPGGVREVHLGDHLVRVAGDGDKVRVLVARPKGGWTATLPAGLRDDPAHAETGTAATRRTALEQLIPRTKIADRATVDGRFLRVRGRLRTFLPFEEDGGRLSLIVSKAFLLADDHEITDPTILAQITRT